MIIQFKNDIDFDIINDVSGNIESELVHELLSLKKYYIAMHSLVIPSSKLITIPLNDNPIEIINEFILQKIVTLEKCGIPRNLIQKYVLFDPGIGFGTTATQAWYIIKNLDKINTYGAEVVLGHSRKSFFSHKVLKSAMDLDLEVAYVAVQLANTVAMVRTHDTISTKILTSM